MAEITKGSIDEFVTNPCWAEIKARLKARQETLFHKILNDPIETLEALETLRIEYKKIAVLLDYPKTFRGELEEEENA